MSTDAQQPSRRSIAAFDSYEEAQDAVDRLSDAGFPVEHVTIVGRGLQYVEQVTGRLTMGRAALMGAAQGAVVGLVLSVLVSIFFTVRPSTAVVLLLLYGVVAGGIFGAIFGAIAHAATGGRRDFASVPGMQAERYEVMVDDELAPRALEVLRAPDADREARIGERRRAGGRTGPRT
jgi:hypothetical protein